MHVLITQSYFGLGGTETYSATVADAFERLGHRVTIHAPEASPQGREMAAARGLELSVGEVLPEGIDAAIAQDGAAAQLLAGRDPAPRQVFVIHGLAPFEHPPRGLEPRPQVIVLNDRTATRAAALAEAPPVVRLRQPIDITRFRPRAPVRPRPRRLLVLSNGLGPPRLGMLEEACEDLGIELMRVGGADAAVDPQEAIAAADIVVGYGRSVLEGMAMGRPAYVWERAGGDGWVTPETYPTLEADGFSGAATDDVIDGERLRSDLADYRPELGELGYELVRKHHSAAKHGEALIGLLAEGIAPARQDSAETISLLVRAERRTLLRSDGIEHGHREVLEWNHSLELQNHELRGRLAEVEANLVEERRQADEARRSAEERRVAEVETRARLDELLGSSSWRLTDPLRRLGTALGRRLRR